MAHIGGDRFREGWRAVLSAMREDEQTRDIQSITIYRVPCGAVEVQLAFTADSAFAQSFQKHDITLDKANA